MMVALQSVTNHYSLSEAVRLGDLQTMKKLLQKGCDINDCGWNNSGTALYWAACRGWHQLVFVLASMDAVIIDKQNCWGATALHGAADSGHLECLRILIAHGADVNKKTRNLDTACHLAATRGHLDVVKKLIAAEADPSLRNTKGRDVMDDAILRGKCEVVSYLCEYFKSEGGRKYGKPKNDVDNAVVTSCIYVSDPCPPPTVRRRSLQETFRNSSGKMVLHRQRSRSLNIRPHCQ